MAPDLEHPCKKKRRGSSGTEPTPYKLLPLPVASTKADADHKMLNSFAERDAALRAITTCKICFRPLYEPFTNQCGHTYCYSCLCQWFSNNGARKTCPDCRTVITRAPAPAYALREVTRELLQRPELLPREETGGHAQWQSEEAAAVEKDKSNADPYSGGLFKGCFRPQIIHSPRLAPLLDLEDGVIRCPECAWELEGQHPYCGNCGYEFESDHGTSRDSDDEEQSDDLEGEIGSEDELDGELSLEDDEFNESMNPGSSGRPLSSSPHSTSSTSLGFRHVPLLDASRNREAINSQRSLFYSGHTHGTGRNGRYLPYGYILQGGADDNDNDDDDDDNNSDDDHEDYDSEDENDNSSMNSFVVNDEALNEESSGGSESSSSTTRQRQPNPISRRLRYTIIDSEDEATSESSIHDDATSESSKESSKGSSNESGDVSNARLASFGASESPPPYCPLNRASSSSESAFHVNYYGSSDDE